MSDRFRNDGTRTGGHNAGDGLPVDLRESTSSRVSPDGTFTVISPSDLSTLKAAQGNRAYWKVEDGALKAMTLDERGEVDANAASARASRQGSDDDELVSRIAAKMKTAIALLP